MKLEYTVLYINTDGVIVNKMLTAKGPFMEICAHLSKHPETVEKLHQTPTSALFRLVARSAE